MALSQEKIDRFQKITGHSMFGPSGMERILLCPASVQESLRADIPPESEYAAHGTKLHDVIAKATTIPKDGDAYTYVKRQLGLELEDKNLLYDSLDYYYEHFPHEHAFTEVEVSLEAFGLPEVYGTADKVGLGEDERGRVLHVLDWKFGSGKLVKADMNSQLLTYGLAACGTLLEPKDFPQIIQLHVVQPALSHYDPFEISYADAYQWYEQYLLPGIALAREDDPDYNPGEEQCRFCNAKATCMPRFRKQQQTAKDVFKKHAMVTTTTPMVTPEQVATFLARVPELEKAIKDLRKYAAMLIQSGRGVPDWKMVHGRSNRKFINPVQAAKWMRKYAGLNNTQLYNTKLISPAQAEKLNRTLKNDDDFQQMVDKPPGKLQLVPADDPREGVVFNDPTKAFKSIVDEG